MSSTIQQQTGYVIDWPSLAIALVPINALISAAIATSDDPYFHSPLVGYTLATLPLVTIATKNPIWLIPGICITGIFVVAQVGFCLFDKTTKRSY